MGDRRGITAVRLDKELNVAEPCYIGLDNMMTYW